MTRWGITTAEQGLNRHGASERSIMLECSHRLSCCRGLPFNGGRRESSRPSGKLRRPTPHTAHRHANVVLSPYGCRGPVYIASQPRARMRWGKPLSSPNATISHNLRRAAVGHLLIATQRQQSIRYRLLINGCARRLQQNRMRVCKRVALTAL